MYPPPVMLVDCSGCRAPLRLPPGAKLIRCAICHVISHIAGGASATTPAPTPTPSYEHVPPRNPPPPAAHGPKRAVICGISYLNTRNELKGCVNDAKGMREFLIKKFHFPKSSIVMLTEEETSQLPTKRNLIMALSWLVQGCQAGDSLVFHYSGHGYRQKNNNGDEVDGYDETLCPLDFEKEGMIVDDKINETIVRPLPCGAKLHAIIDSCHSGTVLDLPFLCRMDRSESYRWEDHRPRSGVWNGTNGGEAIAFSGCDDDQNSADTTNSADNTALSKITSTGAMTYCFLQAFETEQKPTYGNILTSMRKAIHNADTTGSGGPLTTILGMLWTGNIPGGGGLTQDFETVANICFTLPSLSFSGLELLVSLFRRKP
ncbi:hypothetical protein Sjap_004664 [Stephania japonica]|uniref:Metacaspase n=1 Tax=Stephania japonica TaxID=461633 RepID=A0AAP0PL42_9MAGN